MTFMQVLWGACLLIGCYLALGSLFNWPGIRNGFLLYAMSGERAGRNSRLIRITSGIIGIAMIWVGFEMLRFPWG